MTATDMPAFGAATPAALTMLDGLLADIDEHPASQDTVDLPISKRPGWSVRCSTDIPYELLAAWRKGAQDDTLAGGTNELTLACSVLIHSCTAVLVDGEPVVSDGQNVDFHSNLLQQKLSVGSAAAAVRKLFVRDGFATSAASALLKEAGFGSEATPTRR